MTDSRDDVPALERRHDELAILFETIRDVTSTLAVHEVLERLLHRVLRHADAEIGAILVVERDGSLRIGAAHGLPREVVEQTHLAPDEGISGHVVSTREPLLIADLAADARFGARASERYYKSSLLSVPLVHRDTTLGVIHVNKKRSGEPFGPADLGLVQAIAGHAAVALANAQRYEALLDHARRDALTGLTNHGYFHSLLEREWERADRYGRRLSVVMLDVDHFKRANDIAGHAAGDRVLRELGGILRQSARVADTPARYGGDELAVLLPETSAEGAIAFAEKVRQAVEAARLGPDDEHPITISAGTATGPGSATSPDELIEAADRALYRAKSRGRNRVCGQDGGRGSIGR